MIRAVERIVKHSAFGAAEQEFLTGRLHREVELKVEGCLAMGLSEEDAEQWVDVNRQARASDADSVVTTGVQDILDRPATPFSAFCRDYAPAFQRGAA